MTTKKKALIAAGLVIVIGGLTGLSVANNREKGASVRSETVERRDLVSTVTASGYLQPKRKVDISADVSGRVVDLRVEEGQWVERGDLLLRIDPTTFEANVRRAEAILASSRAQLAQSHAQLTQARSALRRAEELARENGLISGEQLEQARTSASVAESQHESARYGVSQAEAGLSEAREALRKTTIIAPMSGRVTRLNIREGETAIIGTMNNPGSLLLTVADLAEMEARVKVDETEVPRITVGDSASIRIDAFPNERFPGRVTQIANSATRSQTSQMSSQPQSVDFEVVVTLDAPPADLRPDLSASADIVTASRQGVLSIPILALTVRDAEGKKPSREDDRANPRLASGFQGGSSDAEEIEGVFVVRDGKAEWIPVKVGITGDRYFEVLEGLEGGETIVSGSYQAVRDLEAGAAVRDPNGAKKKTSTDAVTDTATRED
jgi:HlyD family secretion protein